MDFSNRSPQPQPVAPTAHSAAGGPSNQAKKNQHNRSKWNRIGIITAVGLIVILLIAIVLAISFSNNDGDNNESQYVYGNKLQAVFLNTGQVYFGNLQSINRNYFVLTNIFYLQTTNSSSSSSSSSSNNNVTLVKLGCELHQPYDRMVINTSQVTFWENLQSSGQVAKAVATWEKDNPNGQKCSDQSSSADTNGVTNTQNANGGSTTPSTSTTSSKP